MKCELSGKEESQPINNSLACRDCYVKVGYSHHGNTMKIQHEQDMVPRRAV